MIIDHWSDRSLEDALLDAQRLEAQEQTAKYVQVSPQFREVSDVELIALILTIRHMHPKYVDALLSTASLEIADVPYKVVPQASQSDIDRCIATINSILDKWRNIGL